mgnify:CR=1 FL=1
MDKSIYLFFSLDDNEYLGVLEILNNMLNRVILPLEKKKQINQYINLFLVHMNCWFLLGYFGHSTKA